MLETGINKNQIIESWDYWYPLVFGYFYRRLNNRQDVEDLTSNTLTALFLNSEVTNPRGFIWQTARNQLYKFIDQKTKNPHPVSLDIQDHQNSFGDYPETFGFTNRDSAFANLDDSDLENKYSDHYQAKIDQLIGCCRNHLEEKDYQIVCLSIMEEKNSTQIAQAFNLKPATVRQKLKRCLGKLKQSCLELWLETKQSNN